MQRHGQDVGLVGNSSQSERGSIFREIACHQLPHARQSCRAIPVGIKANGISTQTAI